ncbi:hypothetical protein SAMN06265795_102281 [Noviherbaspirillum humi]|uniref:Uncharacterized protein n=1 Tax=Noviherbaspirillum humi TaxID=1688639 RepID=A0A239DMN2_9BURK|nr:hypothetical protein [Noviherbaspirillum humi]SNS33895.1 hypothetical protein SAMN06265795_102281 [Noviherbaspirillum humi]
MTLSKPNRTRQQSADRNEMQEKQSGDQHILPIDESEADPHRPHRTNRQDMQKTMQGGSNNSGQGQ